MAPLGNIMQPIIAKDYEDQYNANLVSTTTPSSVKDDTDSDYAKGVGGVIDAKIIDKDDD